MQQSAAIKRSSPHVSRRLEERSAATVGTTDGIYNAEETIHNSGACSRVGATEMTRGADVLVLGSRYPVTLY